MSVSCENISAPRHIPVLLQEVVKLLDPKAGEFFIDGTVDGGGHAREIIKRIAPGGKFLGIDLDVQMVERLAREYSAAGPGLLFIRANYADLPDILRRKKLGKVDGLLLDLGFSSEQLERSGRGFSFTRDEPLLMTYDDSRAPVREILKKLGVEELARVIREFGEERFAQRIARAIKERLRRGSIETTRALCGIIANAVPKSYKRGRINPATRTFQAFRIYANDELGNLERLLGRLPEVVRVGGRIAVISFHSLEDRVVKRHFRELECEGVAEILTKKPITASEEEIAANPRSRSAKLRAAAFIKHNFP